MEGHYTQGYGDGRNAPETPITLLPGAAAQAAEFLAGDAATRKRIDRVATLIEGFETPFGMELLATVHWVMTHDADAKADVASAINAVHGWSSHKAASMKPGQIRIAWEHLREHGWA